MYVHTCIKSLLCFLIVYRADLNQSQREKRMGQTKRDEWHAVANELDDLPQTSGIIPGTTECMLIYL